MAATETISRPDTGTPAGPVSAPTEQEIREAIEATATSVVDHVHDGIRDAASPLTNPAFLTIDATEEWTPGLPDPADLWTDLRLSEAMRLRALTEEAIVRAGQRCEAIILEELTGAGVTFATEYPDAPRPVIQ